MPELDSSLAGEWRFDPAHTRLGFSTRHAMVTKVRGAFNDVEGVINVDAEEPTNSTVSVTIKVASIDTRNEQRDQHLRTNDFFDAPHHPEITFVSKRIDQIEENSFIVNGDLTIRGVTREIAIPIGTRSGTCGRASRAPGGSTARTSASTGTRPSTRAACSSPTASCSSSRSRP